MKRIFNLMCIAVLFAACTKNITEIQSEKQDFQSNQSENSRGVEDVKSIALTAMEDFFPEQTKAGIRLIESVTPFHGLTKSSSSDNTLFYIVNFENDGGFVLVGAKTNAPEVIACIDKGNYDGGITPIKGFNMYIEDISAQLESVSVSRIDIPTDPTGYITKPNDATTVVNPLVSVSWHQGQPFNWYCSVPFNDEVPCGCVATAVAQIMSVYESPTSISLTYPNAHTSSISLDWANMKKVQHASVHSTTCQYCIQNAALLREIGERIGMNYGIGGSVASSANAPSVYSSFGYSCSSYSDYSLANALSSLEKGYPVHIRAEDEEGEGHAWVVDGSKYIRDEDVIYEVTGTSTKRVGKAGEEEYYLHFNYGWSGGSNNGYYLAKKHEYGNGPIVYGGTYDTYPVTMFTGVGGLNIDVKIITDIRPRQ